MYLLPDSRGGEEEEVNKNKNKKTDKQKQEVFRAVHVARTPKNLISKNLICYLNTVVSCFTFIYRFALEL